MVHVTGALFDVAAFGGVARHQHHQGQCMVNLDEKDLAVTADNRKNGGARMAQKANGTAAKTEQRAAESVFAVSARGSTLPYFEHACDVTTPCLHLCFSPGGFKRASAAVAQGTFGAVAVLVIAILALHFFGVSIPPAFAPKKAAHGARPSPPPPPAKPKPTPTAPTASTSGPGVGSSLYKNAVDVLKGSSARVSAMVPPQVAEMSDEIVATAGGAVAAGLGYAAYWFFTQG